MYLYELSYLISPEISEEELNNHMEEINSLIAKEGELKKTESLGLKNLGRFIKEKKTAYLVSSLFKLEPEKLLLLKEEIKKNKAVFQSIIIRKKEEKERKERVKKSREEREEKKTTREEPEKKENLEKIGEKLDEILKD